MLIILSAPSGSGKTTLSQQVMADEPNITRAVTCTTRAPRSGEVEGRDYYFLTPASFEKLKKSGGLLEWAEVHGNFYGTPRVEVEKLTPEKFLLLIIDWQGARKVRQQWPKAMSIFLMPPSLEELERRLRQRGQDSEAAIACRLVDAQEDMTHADEFDHVIINHNVPRSAKEFLAIVREEKEIRKMAGTS